MPDNSSTLGTALSVAQIKLVHLELEQGHNATAANLIKYALGETPDISSDSEGIKIIRTFFNAMVDADNYVGAAALCWGPPLFHPELQSVREIFEAAAIRPLLLSMGASSMGKTYNLVIFCYMDWLRDPEWTSVKLMSQSDKHLAENVWPHLKQIHEACALKPEGKVKEVESALWLGLEDADKSYGFSGHAFKQSQLSSGVWKGFKSQPKRPVTAVNYPKFGPMTRLRVLMDEAQQIPAGVWQDLESVKAGIGDGRVKIFAAFNPEDVSQPVVRLAEPVGGWHTDQQETLYSYESAQGWWVVRLDGARCENVIQRIEIYPGVMRYEAYIKTLQGGGDSSPRYWCADEATEVLSKRGWLRFNQLVVGEDVYTLNTETGLGEWCPTQEVFVKPFDGNLVSLEGRGFSALVTDNHKWPVTHKQRTKARRNHFSLKETRNLGLHDLIPLKAAPCSHKDSIHSSDFAELIGWVLTDGSIGRHNSVVIYQSVSANPEKCARIEALLERFGASVSVFVNKNNVVHYRFSGSLGKKVHSVLGKKKNLTMDFIESLDNMGREALMDAMILGDGGTQGGGTRYYCQDNANDAGIFAALAARVGYSTVTHERWIRPDKHNPSGHTMFYVNVRSSAYTRLGNINKKETHYTGNVWCPRTKNGTFLARRNGCVYFTGNTFARGFPPLQDSANTVIPPDWASTQRGEALYVGHVDNVASVDLAYQGADKAVIAIGRWGLAYGWRNQNGKVIRFVNRLNPSKEQPRHVLTIDQFFTMPKSLDIMGVTQEVMGKCKMLRITPEWVSMDCTGNAAATYSYASKFWGRILGINWAEGATEMKVLSDDLMKADERFDGVPSEMWFATKHWLDPNVCAVLFNPTIQSQDLYSQMTTRRYKHMRNGRMHIESKDEYKARNAGKSPDEMDAVVMLVHLVRVRGGVIPGIIEQQNRNEGKGSSGTPVTPTAELADRDVELDLTSHQPLEGEDGEGGDLEFGD